MCNNRISLAHVIFLILISFSYLFATRYHVALNGSDNNNGSITQPWETIMYAIENTSGGDSILIWGGTYPEQTEIWLIGSYGHGGTAGHWKTIMAYPDETVFLSQRFLVDADYVRVEGLNFSNGNILSAVEWDGPTSHVEFLNNYFYGPYNVYCGAINYKGSYGLIEGNRLELEDTGSSNDHGIYILSGAHTIVRNNYINGVPAYGIHVYDEPNGYTPQIEDVTIENNVVIGSHRRSGIIVSIHQSSNQFERVKSVHIHNNILVNNAHAGLSLADGTLRNIDVFNNVFYNNDIGIEIYSDDIDSLQIINNAFSNNQSYHIDNSSSINYFNVTHNLYYQPQSIGAGINDLHPVFGNPLFVDPAGLNFQLSPNSIAIDSGIFVGLPFVGAAPDLGAFEYTPPTSSSDPSNLKPKKFNLKQNYPNPFNPETSITYEISETTHVKLSIFNTIGNEIKVLVDEMVSPGVYTIRWDGKDSLSENVATGIYFCRMKIFDAKLGITFSDEKKLVLLR
jgi:hypothetical protein